MGLYEEFAKQKGGNRYLQRIMQHVDSTAQAGYDLQGRGTANPLEMLKHVLVDAGLGTVIGLPSDLGTMAGEDIFGQYVGEMAQRTAKGSAENNEIANAYLEGGPGAALARARQSDNSALAWASGAGAIFSDPVFVASLLAGGASKAKDAPKVLKLADYALNRPTDEIVGAVTPIARQVIDKAGPLVKRGKPATERQVIEQALAPREVIDEVGKKPLKLGREKIEQGNILQPQALSLTPEQARQEARRLLGEQQARQASKAKTEALVAAMPPPKSATKPADLLSPLKTVPEAAPSPQAQEVIKSAKAKGPAAVAPELAPVPKRKGKVGQVAFSPPSGDLGGEAVDFNDLAQLMGGPAPEMDLTSPLKESQKNLGIVDPRVDKAMKGIAKQMALTPIRSGAGVGALIGGAGAQDTDGDGNVGIDERLRATAEGAAVGALAGGATKVPVGTLRDVAKIGNKAGKENFSRAVKEGKFFNGPALAGDWSADKVVTPRNALMDEISGRFRGLMAGLKQSDINGTTKSLVERSKAAGHVAEFDQELEDILKLTGQDPAEFNARAQFGQGFVSDVLGGAEKKGPILHPAASGVAGFGYGTLDPANLVVPVLGNVFGALRGVARPYTSEFFHATNDLTHMGIRNTAYKVELRRLLNDVGGEMIGRLKAAGLDTSGLDARGLFSPDQIKALGGPEANRQAAVWADVLRQVYGQGETRGLAGKFVVDTFGNYSTRNALQKAMNALSPFSRYQLGQIPVVAKMAAKNPAAALMIANVLQRSGGKIAVPADTPIIGGLVQEELGGEGVEGEGSISPISALLPVPTDINKGAQALDYADNPYEQALALLEGAGFGVNPLIRTGGYLVGADDLGPGTQSRFAGIEQAMPGPKLPTIAGVLREGRKSLAPIDKYGSDYDPVETRLNELVLETTKKPLSDPSNHALAVALVQDPEHPLWKLAEEQARHGQATKSALSGVSPVTISAKTATDEKGDKARKGMPYTPEQIRQAATVSERAAKQMQAANDKYKRDNPAAATGDRPKLSAKETQDPRLTAWERRNAALKSLNPSFYAQQRAEFMKLAGIK